ncbi:MAG TPA: DUF192 domain-containing protein [Actinomycetota bacterium]|nr:DUF192 domain-containing protein [Actinomycetota bacterium]
MRRLALLLLALLLAACGSDAPSSGDGRVPLTIRTGEGEVTLRVEVADASDERAEGLSNRTSLPADAGMAFVWDRPVNVDFWMKDTLIPLQIAFWDEGRRIVALFDMEPCTAEPCPTYGPDGQILGAAEANAGWFTEHGVGAGDTVELDA